MGVDRAKTKNICTVSAAGCGARFDPAACDNSLGQGRSRLTTSPLLAVAQQDTGKSARITQQQGDSS
jgi:hypothetical protein